MTCSPISFGASSCLISSALMNHSRPSKRGPVGSLRGTARERLALGGASQCDCIAENSSIKEPDGDASPAHSLIDFGFRRAAFLSTSRYGFSQRSPGRHMKTLGRARSSRRKFAVHSEYQIQHSDGRGSSRSGDARRATARSFQEYLETCKPKNSQLLVPSYEL